MVRLKIKRSTPRLVLKTEPALVPPKALPNPAPRTWSRMKLMTATQSIICTIRIAGSHWAKICSSLSCSPICFLRDYIILRKPGRKVVTDERHLEISPVILSAAKDLATRRERPFAALRVTRHDCSIGGGRGEPAPPLGWGFHLSACSFYM